MLVTWKFYLVYFATAWLGLDRGSFLLCLTLWTCTPTRRWNLNGARYENMMTLLLYVVSLLVDFPTLVAMECGRMVGTLHDLLVWTMPWIRVLPSTGADRWIIHNG